jgi:hypothetical protein
MLVNTDRTKVLQITIFMAVRAMRAVFCGILCGVSTLNLRPVPWPNDYGVLKAALNVVEVEEQPFGSPEGLTGYHEPQKRLVHTPG